MLDIMPKLQSRVGPNDFEGYLAINIPANRKADNRQEKYFYPKFGFK